MKDERRINLRFDAEVWKRLEEKRSKEEAKFQQVGERLFLAWLEEGGAVTSPFGDLTKDEERLLRAVLRYWREGPDADLLKQAFPFLIRQWGPRKQS